MAKTTHTVHGIKLIRTRYCNQCGACGSDCLQCPHGEKRADGKIYCKIQGTKEEVCDYWTNTPGTKWYGKGKEVTNKICKLFPYDPWLRVIREGKCNYKFERKDKASMDTLPFVGNKFIKK